MPKEIINKQRLDDSKPAKTLLKWRTAKGKGQNKGGGNDCVLLKTAGRGKKETERQTSRRQVITKETVLSLLGFTCLNFWSKNCSFCWLKLCRGMLSQPLTLLILGSWKILVVRGCPMGCRMLSSLTGLHPLDARSAFLSRCRTKCLQTWTNVPQGNRIAPG